MRRRPSQSPPEKEDDINANRLTFDIEQSHVLLMAVIIRKFCA